MISTFIMHSENRIRGEKAFYKKMLAEQNSTNSELGTEEGNMVLKMLIPEVHLTEASI